MLRRHKCAVSGMAFVAVLALGVAPAMAGTFDDVPADFWARDAIDHITTLHIMDGCGGTFFCPHEVVTREDMAVWLERVEHYSGNSYTPPGAAGLFADVPVQACTAPWLEQLYRDGLTVGCNLTPLLFCPRKIMSRSEMAIFLVRLQHGTGYTPPPCTGGVFNDVPCPSKWPPADYIEQLAADGVTAGCSIAPPLFCPWGAVTRAQMAVFLTRVLCTLHPNTCMNGNVPETGPDVVTITLDTNDDGHELLPE